VSELVTAASLNPIMGFARAWRPPFSSEDTAAPQKSRAVALTRNLLPKGCVNDTRMTLLDCLRYDLILLRT
jgi:hypothetical protein